VTVAELGDGGSDSSLPFILQPTIGTLSQENRQHAHLPSTAHGATKDGFITVCENEKV